MLSAQLACHQQSNRANEQSREETEHVKWKRTDALGDRISRYSLNLHRLRCRRRLRGATPLRGLRARGGGG